MSRWNWRVVRKSAEGFLDSYGIHEVYYDDEGEPEACTTEEVGAYGDDLDDLRDELRLMLVALDKPVLDYDSFGKHE